MTRYNERLAQAGALIALDGLHPPANGARIRFKEGNAEVAVGPLPESNGVLGGYWMIRAESLQTVDLHRKRKDFVHLLFHPDNSRRILRFPDFVGTLTP